jgi:hypothetical protein
VRIKPTTWTTPAGLLLVLTAAAWAQGPAPATRGTCLSAEGHATPIQWKAQNLKVTETADALRLEVEPRLSGAADSDPLALAPLHLYTLTMTCRRGPGLGLVVWVKWTDADQRPGARQMVWQLPDRFRINWWPLSAHKNTYAQRFCLPAGATQTALQIAVTGHPDAGHNYFELYDLTLVRGAEVPFGPNLGPNLCPGGDMEAAIADGMALGWGFWGTPPDAKVLEKDAQGRPAHGGRHFLAFPADKSCILVDGTVPIEQGRAYRVSLWARGKGDLGVGAQSLEAREGQRVADAQQVALHVDAQDWQPFSLVWFAEALYAANANLFMGINPQTELDLDDVTFQRIDP